MPYGSNPDTCSSKSFSDWLNPFTTSIILVYSMPNARSGYTHISSLLITPISFLLSTSYVSNFNVLPPLHEPRFSHIRRNRVRGASEDGRKIFPNFLYFSNPSPQSQVRIRIFVISVKIACTKSSVFSYRVSYKVPFSYQIRI